MIMANLATLSQLNGLILAHLNICSIRNKMTEVTRILHLSKISCLGISESNLDDTVDDCLLQVDNYILMRLDRVDRTVRVSGGGVALYVAMDLDFEVVKDMSHSDRDLEVLCVRLKLKHTRPVFLFNVYRPPHGNVGRGIWQLGQLLQGVFAFGSSEYFLMGDFNINALDKSNADTKTMTQFLNAFNLSHFIDVPTRVTPLTSSCIDLILGNRSEIVKSSGTIPIGCSDHCLIYFQRKLDRPRENAKFITVRLLRIFKMQSFWIKFLPLTGPI